MGLPEGIDFAATESLRLQLVTTFAEQLEGTGMMQIFRSIKARLMVLVLISSLPGLVVIGVLGTKNRDYVQLEAQNELKRVVELLAYENERLVDGTRQLLAALSQFPEIRGMSRRAGGLLKKIRSENRQYGNIFVATADGTVVAASLPFSRHNVRHRKYFRDAKEKMAFSAGECMTGITLKIPVLHFAYPVLDDKGRFIGIIAVSLDLSCYSELLSVAKLPRGSNIALTDHRGKRLYRYPGNEKYAGLDDLSRMMAHMGGPASEGVFTEEGVDSLERFYAYKKLFVPGDTRPYLFMRVGMPVGQLNLSSRKEFLTGMVLLVGSLLVALTIAWLLGKVVIGKKLDVIMKISRRFGAGDFSETIKVPAGGDELNELARVLNEMAGKIEEREREARTATEALQNSEDTLRSIFNSVHDAIFIHKVDGTIVQVNDRMLEMYGVAPGEALSLSITKDYSPRGAHEDWLSNIWREVLPGCRRHFEWKSRRPGDGSLFDVEIFLTGIKVKGEDHILATARDITSRKRMERALERQRILMETVVNAMPAAVFYKDRQGVYLGCNKVFAESLGCRQEDIVGRTVFDLMPRDLAEAYAGADRRLFSEGSVQVYEAEFLYADDVRHQVMFHKAPFRAGDGTIAGLVGVMVDITDRKAAEERLRASLGEKEVLLKEIHHRVKNNLQIISSLLNLQSSYIRDKKMLDIFRESQTRVKTMALVHQKLYQSGDLTGIDFREYAGELVRDLFRTYGAIADGIRYEVRSDDILLDIDTVIPLGLIVSELVSNALKHAFPGGRQGSISISLLETREDRLVLTVTDDGVGFPEGLDFTATESLGLQLVTTLTEQLEGTMKLERVCGTKFIINVRGVDYVQ